MKRGPFDEAADMLTGCPDDDVASAAADDLRLRAGRIARAMTTIGDLQTLVRRLVDGRPEWWHEPNGTGYAYCERCGSREVQISGWIDANNGEDCGSLDDGADGTYCTHCETNAGITYDRREAAAMRLDWRREGLDPEEIEARG